MEQQSQEQEEGSEDVEEEDQDDDQIKIAKQAMNRPELSNEMLEIDDKRAFVKLMNYRISIPIVLVRINATYYQKLSNIV